MPYAYVFNAKIRTVLNINLENDILIVDEAHNIPQVIEDACSFSLDTVTFIRVLAELNNIETKVNNQCSALEIKINDMKDNLEEKTAVKEKEK